MRGVILRSITKRFGALTEVNSRGLGVDLPNQKKALFVYR